MRMPRFVIALCSLMLAAKVVIVEATERIGHWLFDLLPTLAETPRLAIDGPALAFETTGTAGDPALLNSLRHEAGMRRLT